MENLSFFDNNDRRKWGWKKISLFPLYVVAGIFVFGTIVMYLWNIVLADVIIGIHSITFWQAIGITILCKILFGGFNLNLGHGGHMHHDRRREIHDKWMQMNPEDKEKMRNEWFERFRDFEKPDNSKNNKSI